MKAVTWGYHQVIQTRRKINEFQMANGPSQQIWLNPSRFTCDEEFSRMFVGERFNHGNTLTCHVTHVKGFVLHKQSK